MRIKMLVEISGSCDGQPWPRKGGVVDVPDGEAKKLIDAEMAVSVESKPSQKSDEVEKRPAPTKGVEKRAAQG